MSARRLRPGEWLALLGTVVLVASLSLRWFGLELRPSSASYTELNLPSTGWGQVGWFVWGTILFTAGLALLMVLLTAAGLTGRAVMATVLTVTFGAAAFTLVAARILLDQPDLGADLPSGAVGVRLGAWVALAASAALLAGAWWAMADERLDAPDSAYTPPPARPAPPPEQPVA